MNRAQRRMLMKQRRELIKGYRWSQRTDPSDPRFVLVEMRFATEGMPEAEYEGGCVCG